MANYATLKAAIQQVVKTNGNNEITGALLQQSLLAMITSLGDGYMFKDVATPATNPGTPDQNVFYIASTAGTYSNFGGIVLDSGDVAILAYNGSWTKKTTGIASIEKVLEIDSGIKKDIGGDFFTIPDLVISNTTGNAVGASLGICTDFLPINNGQIIVRGLSSQTAAICAFYDENKTFISAASAPNNTDIEIIITDIPANAKYFRCSAYKANTKYVLFGALFETYNRSLLNELSIRKLLNSYDLKLGSAVPSYVNIGEHELANIGDYFEIRMQYYGNTTGYEDKNCALTLSTATNARFGYNSNTTITLRVAAGGANDLNWTGINVDLSEMHTYKIVKVATGYELFIDGESKGVKTYSGTSNYKFSYLGLNSTNASVLQKWIVNKLSVSISGTVTEILFREIPGTNVELVQPSQPGASGEILTNFVSYSNTNKELMAFVNIPGTTKYLGFSVKLFNSRGTLDNEILYKYFWEIDDDNSYIYNYQNGSMNRTSKKILGDGESEFVTQMVTGDPCDFTGGVHGDEAIDIANESYVKFFADGVELNVSGDIPLTPCNQISYIQKSTLHRTARIYNNYKTNVPISSGSGVLSLTSTYTYAIDGIDTGLAANAQNSVYRTIEAAISGDNLTLGQDNGFWTISKVRIVDETHAILATHNKETIFSNQGYITKNALVFTESGAEYSYFTYHGICCAGRIAATVGHNENYVDVNFTGSQSNLLQDSKFRMFQARNDVEKISVIINAKITDGGGMFTDEQCSMFVWDRGNNSKYYRRTPNYTPNIGARFASEMSVFWGMTIE